MTFSGYQTDADYVGPKKFGGRTIDTSDWTYYWFVEQGSTVTIDSVTYYLGMVMLGQVLFCKLV